MIYRFLPTGLLLVGLALLGAAAVAYFVPADGPGVSIDEPEREFTAWDAGQHRQVIFRIHNPTRHTVRVVGLADC
jgi:hypothetical protein